jgi:nucleolar protein 15
MAPSSLKKKIKAIEPVPTSISRPRKSTAPSKPTKSKKPKEAVPEPEEDEEVEENGGADEVLNVNEGSDSEGHLHGFSTDDDDSSDEEDALDDGPSEFDLGKLPTIAKDDATVKRKLEKAKQHPVRL